MAIHIRRREFIFTLSGVAAAWPLAARAQRPERMRRIGVLMNLTADDADGKPRITAFLRGLEELGWSPGRNLQIDYRWAPALPAAAGRAAELVALNPDVLITVGGPRLGVLQQATRTIPVVFVEVIDPVGAALVASLARPGGNATGFTLFEYSIGGKWLELLKLVAPGVNRAVIIRDPSITSGAGQLAAIQTVAPSLGVELRPVDVRDDDEIERGIAALARSPNGGVIVPLSTLATFRRDRIITLVARHRLPAVFPARYFVAGGGLISYAPDNIEQYRLAAGYVDRILKGEKPAELPVQAPTKFELVINLRTARELGFEIPATVLARANEVIE
jgi:putative ABC transport system substrate-binding protein